MARTRRQFIGRTGRDGETDLRTIVQRDNRATGLRDHRRDRREARVELRLNEDDTAVAGKKRRYSTRYGDYRL